ncbi:hypothetical protein KFL_000910210 [Klebsormidium nitens]|uniref:FAS1 domain-containing protein n=1 Tax=Klebsormidium nitens TaxID=105231 RepID=A0A1Y1HXX2_KLENI|nr:hypothetical protein KFL_000910210 [Klebsormidium nitens]|eukprot:GAQ81801.1 hypothetical protein KFL_000910210 [Klebsormidium nitens]
MAFLRPAFLVLLFALSVSAGRSEPPKKPYLVQGGGRIGQGVIVKAAEARPLPIPYPPYVVGGVPTPFEELFEKVVKALVAKGKFTILIEIITKYIDTKALLVLVEKAGPATLFAPTDEAFSKIPYEILEGLKERPEILIKLIAYHFVKGVFPAKELLSRPKTALKSILEIDITEIDITIKKAVVLVGVGKVLAKVTEADVIVVEEKVVVHAIDFVIAPPNFVIFAAAVKKEVVVVKKPGYNN